MSAKFIQSVIVFFVASIYMAHCQSVEDTLAKADSLFGQKKYTESYDYYDGIFFEHGQYSTQMLLKMAFIKEGLGEFDKALFFLYKYYNVSFDSRVLDKIEKLSSEHNLSGYKRTDVVFALNFIRKNFESFAMGLSIVILLLLGVIFYKRFILHQRPLYSGIGVMVLMLALFALVNFAVSSTEAIIVSNKTFLMSGPSPGADLIAVMGKGHKVDVLQSEDVWTKISTDGKVAYTRTSNLLMIP